MKKNILFYLFALLPLASSFAQDSSSCGASCLWTWCTITCYDPNGDLIGAQCYCSWGFAHCKCLRDKTKSTVHSNYSNKQSLAQRNALAAYQDDLSEIGQTEVAGMIANIQTAIDRGDDISQLVASYVNRIDALSAEEKEAIQNLIDSYPPPSEELDINRK